MQKGLRQDPDLLTAENSTSPREAARLSDGVKGVVIFAVVMLLAILGWGIARGIGSKTPEYKPNDVQMLRLQVKQKDAQMKHIVLTQAQAEFNAAYAALMDEANAVKKENKWPAETLVDPDKLQFSAPPKPIPAPPAVTSSPEAAKPKK